MASSVQAGHQHLQAFGMPIMAQTRASGSADKGQDPAFLSRLLDRIDARIEDDKRRARSGGAQHNDPASSLAIALTQVSLQIGALPPSSNTSTLQAHLSAIKQRYIALNPLQQDNARSISPFREYLLKDVVDESDSDSEYESELRSAAQVSPRAPAAVVDATNGRQGQVASDKESNSVSQDDAMQQKDEDDDVEAYEAAAGLRRRNHREKQENEKKWQEEEEAPPTAIQSERGIQDALSGELLRMAGILKTNSIKFADALERDRQVLEGADEKLQGNLTLMTRTRGRLGDYSRKARSMGWVTLGSVVVVCMSWMLMFVVIRLT